MRIDVYFTPLGLNAGDVSGRGVVVIDALRATTSVVTALANGAKEVIPAATSEEAVRLASNLEKDGVLLAGERKSVKIEGFALGNSPREMTPEVVAGKTIVLATTNGTPALVAPQRVGNEARRARRVSRRVVWRVSAAGGVDRRPFVTGEYVDGEGRASLVRRVGGLPEGKALGAARQGCAGLSAAHVKGVLHRD